MQSSFVSAWVKWVAYTALTFTVLFVVGLALGEFYVPIKQLLSGESADFSQHWQEADIAGRLWRSLAIALGLTLYRYIRTRKKAAKDSF